MAEKMTRVTAIKKFFSTADKPVTMAEFKALWQSLEPAERDELAQACATELDAELESALPVAATQPVE